MESIITLLWVGGWTPAYRAARINNHTIFGSIINALIWPADVGWCLAEKYCQDDKL